MWLPFRCLVFGLLAALLFVGYETDGKVMTRCEAALELQRARISRSLLGNWVCLMENASGLDTRKVVGPLRASSYNFGIFQISSSKWCTRGRRGGTCNVRCEDLLSDNIQEGIACAKKIFDSQGFGGWEAWNKSCKNKPVPVVTHCRR